MAGSGLVMFAKATLHVLRPMQWIEVWKAEVKTMFDGVRNDLYKMPTKCLSIPVLSHLLSENRQTSPPCLVEVWRVLTGN